MYFTDRILELQDEAYGKFQSKIVPNIDSRTILGVRIPQLKALAKQTGARLANLYLQKKNVGQK